MEPKNTMRFVSVMVHPFIILSQGDWISTRMSQEFSRWSGNGFFHLLINGIYLGLYTHYKDFRHSRWDDHFQNNVIYDPSPPIEVPGLQDVASQAGQSCETTQAGGAKHLGERGFSNGCPR